MVKINKSYLSTLYKSEEINEVWLFYQNEAVIQHPKYGWTSPNNLRSEFNNKPCPYCAKKMVHGKELFTTVSEQDAISRGWQYVNANGVKVINRAGSLYFHTHYVTLDHILNKARFPEKMFDADNLQVICWKCNQLKGDNNNFDSEQTQAYLDSLAEAALSNYLESI